MTDLTPEMLIKRERILNWMSNQRQPSDLSPPPVLLSDMKRDLSGAFDAEAFEGLRRDGVIRAEFPEAKRGDGGRQFWNFAHMTAIEPNP